MKLNARIKVINALAEGVSKANGKPWKSQEIILGWDEQYAVEPPAAQHGNSVGDDTRTREQLLVVKLRGQGLDIFAERGYRVGDEISGRVDFDTRMSNGHVYNDIHFFID